MSEKYTPHEAAEWKAPSIESESLDQEQAAIIAFGPLLDSERMLGEAGGKQERAKIFKDITEHQFLISHYVWQNSENKPALKEFWETAHHQAKANGLEREFYEAKKGIISQVGALKVFEALGEKPELAHPRDDAFNAIDMWEGDSAVQIKGAPVEQAAIIPTTEIAFPAVKTVSPQSEKFYNSKFEQAAKQFRMKTEAYQRESGKEINSYFLVLPVKEIDSVTGKPSDKLVDDVRGLLGKETNQAA